MIAPRKRMENWTSSSKHLRLALFPNLDLRLELLGEQHLRAGGRHAVPRRKRAREPAFGRGVLQR